MKKIFLFHSILILIGGLYLLSNYQHFVCGLVAAAGFAGIVISLSKFQDDLPYKTIVVRPKIAYFTYENDRKEYVDYGEFREIQILTPDGTMLAQSPPRENDRIIFLQWNDYFFCATPNCGNVFVAMDDEIELPKLKK